MTVLVAGGGPAGTRLAIKLAEKGISVTLVERLTKPSQNAFSSAALPIKTVDEFSLPVESISSYWNGWQLIDPLGIQHKWIGNDIQGVVLDFAVFRRQMWNQAENAGVKLLLGWSADAVISNNDFAYVLLKGPNQARKELKFKCVIDATGHNRSLIRSFPNVHLSFRDQLLKGTGIEYILDLKDSFNSSWKNNITFYLGTKWINYGYGWVFPMGENRLKVGVCRLPPINKRLTPLSCILARFIDKVGLRDCRIIDKHGGVVSSYLYRSETHSFGRVFAVGDSVSTANLLGGEGIRHALLSADVLLPFLLDMCSANGFSNSTDKKVHIQYKKALRKKLGWRWVISSRLARRTWWGLDDENADRRIGSLINGLSQKASAEDLSALLFDYRFERYGFRLFPYLMGWR